MKKYCEYCERCSKDRTFKVGKKTYFKSKKDGYGIKREFYNCMFCGWSPRERLSIKRSH